MATEDRERHFDQALARHLRAENPGASAGARGFKSSGDCLDTETLAAYHERSLLPEEMSSCKEHIVGCPHCQAVLAQLELTDEIPLAAAEEQLVEASLPAASAAALAPARSASPEAAARKARRLQLLRGASWQWLTATGALAAGLLVWVAIHENGSLPLKNRDFTKVAESRAPAPAPSASVPTDSKVATPNLAADQNLPSKQLPVAHIATGSVTTGAGAGNGRREDALASKQSPAVARALPRRANSLDDKDRALKKEVERDAALNKISPEVATDESKTSTEGTVTAQSSPQQKEKKEQLDAANQSLNAQAQNQVQNQANYAQNYSVQKAGGPNQLNQATPAPKIRARTADASAAPPAKPDASSPQPAPPPAPPAGVTGGVTSNYSSSSLEMISVINPRLIPVAGTNFLWRAGRSGLIDFSKDGGSSWSHQNSGVLTDLLTGSAPSNQVCWIIGRVGAIVLTTDGGANWRVIKSPLTEDLGGVQATDALHATIWNARSTKRIQTSDGGVTWTSAPAP